MPNHCCPDWVTGNPHIDLLRCWPSIKAISRDTGLSYANLKRWAREGKIADPSAWRIIAEAAGMDDPDAWVVMLANTWNREES